MFSNKYLFLNRKVNTITKTLSLISLNLIFFNVNNFIFDKYEQKKDKNLNDKI